MGPRGRSAHGHSCSGAFAGDDTSTQRWTFEIDAMGAVDDAVENGVGQGRIANHLVPASDRDLACDQQRSSVAAIVDDLEQVAALLRIERFRPPIIDDQEAGSRRLFRGKSDITASLLRLMRLKVQV